MELETKSDLIWATAAFIVVQIMLRRFLMFPVLRRGSCRIHVAGRPIAAPRQGANAGVSSE
jgi:hypothetical protein